MTVANTETSFPSQPEIKTVKCASCGFTEECTMPYISRIKERYNGNWICGLCIEAVKDEVLRSEMSISTEEALNRHVMFCKKFQSFECDEKKTEYPIFAMVRVLRRSLLDSPRSMPSSPMRESRRRLPLMRSESCFSSLSRTSLFDSAY